MEATEKEGRALPPYVPYKTFKNFLEGLRVAMPGRIDRSIMRSYSGAAQSQIIGALKYLRLVNRNDQPTEYLMSLLNSEGPARQKEFQSLLHTCYPFVFRDGFNLQAATPRQLGERFEDVGATGDTVRRCIAFFLAAAADAGLSLSPHISIRQRTRRSGTTRQRRQGVSDENERQLNDLPPSNEPVGLHQLLLAKFPTFDPAWSPDVQGKWFDSFQKLMKTVESQEEKK